MRSTTLVLHTALAVHVIVALPHFLPYRHQYCANDTDVMDHLLMETAVRYNRHKLPSQPVTVRIEMWVQEVTSVSELTQDFEIGTFPQRQLPISPRSFTSLICTICTSKVFRS